MGLGHFPAIAVGLGARTLCHRYMYNEQVCMVVTMVAHEIFEALTDSFLYSYSLYQPEEESNLFSLKSIAKVVGGFTTEMLWKQLTGFKSWEAEILPQILKGGAVPDIASGVVGLIGSELIMPFYEHFALSMDSEL